MKFTIGFFLLSFSLAAEAATCWPEFIEAEIIRNGGDPFLVAIEKSDVVIIGEANTTYKTTVRTKGQEEVLLKVESHFEVKESLKGDVENVVVIYSGDECGCKYNFEPGVEYIVLAAKHKHKYETYYCQYIRPNGVIYKNEYIEAVKVNKANH